MLELTLYIPPNGKTRKVAAPKIDKEDEEWFLKHRIVLSAETLHATNIFYGRFPHQDEEDEAMEIQLAGMTPADTFKKLRKLLEHQQSW